MIIDPISQQFRLNAGTHGPVALMYHSVERRGGTPAWPWAVSLQRFVQQLDYLAEQGYCTMTMSEVTAGPPSISGRIAVITFDDGYVDNLAACDELCKRGMLASWYIVSDSVGRTPKWAADDRPPGRLLDASELRQMQAAGMEIGSHGVNHLALPRLGDAELRRELVESKSAIEDAIGNRVASFAYPYGSWDVRCANAVREAGYTSACTTRAGWALRDGDPYTVRRLTVFHRDKLATFARNLIYGDNRMTLAKALRIQGAYLMARILTSR